MSHDRTRRHGLFSRNRRRSTKQARKRREVRRLLVEPLEARYLLASDFGDAPDTGAGTGAGNYETTSADGGPSHTIVAGLFLGATVDGD